MGRLSGKTALVTGATQGLGLEVARQFQAEGAQVILSGIDDARGGAGLNELPGSEYWTLDVAQECDWVAAVERLQQRGQTLDILVNNAAIVRYEAIANCSAQSFAEVMNVNLMGVFFGIREMIRVMPKGGSIINISSCAGLEGVNGAASYVASKFAVTGLTKAAALELGHRGIRVNSVHPRAMATNMIAGQVDAPENDSLFERQAIPRIGHTSEIAAMVLFLASADSAYCTGGAYLVDGGYMAGEIVKSMAMS